MTAESPADRMTKWLAACGIVAPIIDTAIIGWLGARDPTYNHARQFISELGATGRPFAGVFSVWCALWGLLFAAFALALARGLEGQRGRWLGPGALLGVAACGALSAFFPCDPGCAGETTSAHVHILIGEIGTAVAVAAPFLTLVATRRSDAWRGCRGFTLTAGVLLAVATGWLAVGHYAHLGRAAATLGAAQRVWYGILYVWVGALAIHLWRMAETGGPVRATAE